MGRHTNDDASRTDARAGAKSNRRNSAGPETKEEICESKSERRKPMSNPVMPTLGKGQKYGTRDPPTEDLPREQRRRQTLGQVRRRQERCKCAKRRTPNNRQRLAKATEATKMLSDSARCSQWAMMAIETENLGMT
eukprot:3766806-Karenia_brevis.AAC.1